MSIRFGQEPFGVSKKDLWLPKMHTVNKRFTTHEPKHVESYSWSQMKGYHLGFLVNHLGSIQDVLICNETGIITQKSNF